MTQKLTKIKKSLEVWEQNLKPINYNFLYSVAHNSLKALRIKTPVPYETELPSLEEKFL